MSLNEVKQLALRIGEVMPDRPINGPDTVTITAAVGLFLAALIKSVIMEAKQDDFCDFFCKTLKEAIKEGRGFGIERRKRN